MKAFLAGWAECFSAANRRGLLLKLLASWHRTLPLCCYRERGGRADNIFKRCLGEIATALAEKEAGAAQEEADTEMKLLASRMCPVPTATHVAWALFKMSGSGCSLVVLVWCQ